MKHSLILDNLITTPYFIIGLDKLTVREYVITSKGEIKYGEQLVL